MRTSNRRLRSGPENRRLYDECSEGRRDAIANASYYNGTIRDAELCRPQFDKEIVNAKK